MAGALASKEGRVKSGSERERVMGRLLHSRTQEAAHNAQKKEGTRQGQRDEWTLEEFNPAHG